MCAYLLQRDCIAGRPRFLIVKVVVSHIGLRGMFEGCLVFFFFFFLLTYSRLVLRPTPLVVYWALNGGCVSSIFVPPYLPLNFLTRGGFSPPFPRHAVPPPFPAWTWCIPTGSSPSARSLRTIHLSIYACHPCSRGHANLL